MSFDALSYARERSGGISGAGERPFSTGAQLPPDPKPFALLGMTDVKLDLGSRLREIVGYATTAPALGTSGP